MGTSPQPTVNNRPIPPDIAEFFMRRMRDIAAGINCCLIGEVLAVQYTNQYPTVTVAVNFQKVIKGIIPLSGNIGEMADSVNDYPNLVSVPLFIYQGGGAALTMPIQARVTSGGQITTRGDMCLIFFCDRDMDIWFQTGQIAPPNSERIHNINDAIAFVGINTILKAVTNYNPNVASLSDKTGERLAQSGMMVAYGGSSAPSGWLLCQGQAVSRTNYSQLFTAIGTTFGSGDGSTTFNLPNLQGQVPVGIGGTLGLTLGQEYGEVTHLLTGPESGIQAHSHTVYGGNNGSGGTLNAGNWTPSPYQDTTTTGPTNAQNAHNNVQPSLGVNWIIKV